VALVAVLAIASSVPLYQQVRQEYIPSNVDEGEFDVNVTAPEGASITAMTEVALQIEKELRSVKGVRLVLASIGGGSALGSVNAARYYVRLVPHVERTFSWRRLLQLKPWKAFEAISPSATSSKMCAAA
jgi:HAE1 family hydrophobic/amphiphilic exporter-1